jgi:hypothetical protein
MRRERPSGSKAPTRPLQRTTGAPDIRHSLLWLYNRFADGRYAGGKISQVLTKLGNWAIPIIKRSDRVKSFVVLL